MEKRKVWSKIAMGMYALAAALAVFSRFLPKPVAEVESVVESYLLGRPMIMVGVAVCLFLGLYIMATKLRCPHCGAMALRKIKICDNCGKDYDEPVVELSEEVAVGEETETAEIPEKSEDAKTGEDSEAVQEQV